MKDLSLMTWKEIGEVNKEKAIAFIVMAPIEEHGLCLPLATDLIEGQAWSKKAMEELEKNHGLDCYFLPTFPIAAASVNEFYGSIHFSMKTTYEVAYEILESIELSVKVAQEELRGFRKSKYGSEVYDFCPCSSRIRVLLRKQLEILDIRHSLTSLQSASVQVMYTVAVSVLLDLHDVSSEALELSDEVLIASLYVIYLAYLCRSLCHKPREHHCSTGS